MRGERRRDEKRGEERGKERKRKGEKGKVKGSEKGEGRGIIMRVHKAAASPPQHKDPLLMLCDWFHYWGPV